MQIRNVGQHLSIVPTIIRDQELKERGFGGIFGVGQGALHPPALAVLSHTPIGATQTIAWVGKGIVYDTGGLSIKVEIPFKQEFIIRFTLKINIEYIQVKVCFSQSKSTSQKKNVHIFSSKFIF